MKEKGFKTRLCLLVMSWGPLLFLFSCSLSLSEQEQLKHLRKPISGRQAIKKQISSINNISKQNWPKQQWWSEYQSEELDCLVKQALKANPTIDSFKAKLKATKANATIQQSFRAPYVWFHAKTNEQQRSQNGIFRALNPRIRLDGHEVDFNFNFRYEFDFWAKNTNLFCAALGQEKAAEAELANVMLLTSIATADSYFAFSSQKKKTLLLEQLLKVEQQQFSLKKIMLAKGLLSKLPVLKQEKELQSVKQQLAESKQFMLMYLHLTNILAGREPDATIHGMTIRETLPHKLSIPNHLSWDLIARRPDLMAQIWLAKSWAYKTGAAMAEFYPNIDLVGLVGLESVTWNKLMRISSGTALLRPAIHLPIFTAGRIKASVAKHKSEFDAAIFAYNDLLLKASQQVLDSLAVMVKAFSNQKYQRIAVKDAKARYQLSTLRKQKGLDSALTSYQYEKEYIVSRLNEVDTKKAQYLASINLIKSLGGGYYQPNNPMVAMK